MQEQGGTAMNDSSGNSRHGTYVELTVDNAWNPYQFAPNALGRSVHIYNEVDNAQYAEIPANNIDVTNGFTFEAWIRPEGWGWATHVFDFGEDMSLVHGHNDPSFEVWVSGTYFSLPDCGDNAWHHVVVTIKKDGGVNSAKVYYDGALAGSGTVGSLTQQERSFMHLGRGSVGNWYRGSMTQVAVYGHELSSTRISEHYQTAIADADPVWRGAAEHTDLAYYNQLTNASVLGNLNFVPIADWMPSIDSLDKVDANAQYVNVLVIPIWWTGPVYGGLTVADYH